MMVYGSIVSVESLDSIIGDNLWFHVRGTINGFTFHWNAIKLALEKVKINRFLLTVNQEENDYTLYFISEGNLVKCSIVNFPVLQEDFSKAGLVTVLIPDEKTRLGLLKVLE